jgi:hypothetical protein
MKTSQVAFLNPVVIIASLAFLVTQSAFGQGTLSGVSNLPYVDTSNSSSSRIPFGTDINSITEWLAQDFHTGNNSEGYLLDSVTIPFDNAIGYPTNFSCQIFDSTTTGGPNVSLGMLSGNSNPRVSGDYSYSTSTILLKPDTDYFLALEAAGSHVYGNNEYLWYRASSTAIDASPGWNINGLWYSLYGGSWNLSPSTYPPAAFEVTAETVPEPSVTGFLLACLASLWSWQSFQRTIIRPNKSPEPTAVGARSSAVAVHVASRRWLSFLR